MSKKKPSLLRIYALSTLISVGLIAFVGVKLGLAALFLVLVLVALEVTFSVDNAVINTRILEKMTPGWQQAFLTVGILIAVFGVRVVLPIVIVATAANMAFGNVVDLALNHPEEYGHRLEEAHVMIASFGGIFLLMIFLDFMFSERKITWLDKIERLLQKAGKLESLSVIVALGVLLGASKLVHPEEQLMVFTAGIIGMLSYLTINSFDTLLAGRGLENTMGQGIKNTFKAGLVGFIYLNIVDASFSLDGVIGAFAITNQILLIAVGLGVGALYVRVLTLHMLRHGVLDKYRYMEHGAHYAIGILATLMLVSLKFEIPEVVAGLSGIAFVITAIYDSYREMKAENAGARS